MGSFYAGQATEDRQIRKRKKKEKEKEFLSDFIA